MRVLSVRQPWAWAIIHGGKDVENRVRNIAGAYRGPVAIHAGLAWDRFWPEDGPLEDAMLDEMHRRRHRKPWPWNEHRGAIIGVVDLVDVHTVANGRVCYDHGRPDGLREAAQRGDGVCSRWAEPEAWHLVLANPRPIKTPISLRGGLGLRWLDPEVRAMVADQLRHGAQR